MFPSTGKRPNLIAYPPIWQGHIPQKKQGCAIMGLVMHYICWVPFRHRSSSRTGCKIRPVPALDVFLPAGTLCLNGASSSSTGCPVAARASLTLTINPFLIGRVPQQGEKCPVLELNEFLRPVLELEWCPNGTQHRQDNCI